MNPVERARLKAKRDREKAMNEAQKKRREQEAKEADGSSPNEVKDIAEGMNVLE